MQVSLPVQASTLEELNQANNDTKQRTVLIEKEMQSVEKTNLTELVRQYRDVFVWSFEDMKGLDPWNIQFSERITNGVLDAIASHEMYSFLDGFNGYTQVRMHPDIQEKTTFVIEWGVFVAVVMMFELKTTPTIFQRVIQEIFADYIPAFMQVFLDDFVV